MLPATARLTRHKDFATAVRRGRRAARGAVVVHLARSGDPQASPRVGFVVTRAVGGAVVRHRVQRRLRHLMRGRLTALPGGALAVVRALPAAARANSAALGADLDAALRRLGSPPAGTPTRPATGSPSRDFPNPAFPGTGSPRPGSLGMESPGAARHGSG